MSNACQQGLRELLKSPPKEMSKEELFVRVMWFVEILNARRTEPPRALQNRTRVRLLESARTGLLELWPGLGEKA